MDWEPDENDGWGKRWHCHWCHAHNSKSMPSPKKRKRMGDKRESAWLNEVVRIHKAQGYEADTPRRPNTGEPRCHLAMAKRLYLARFTPAERAARRIQYTMLRAINPNCRRNETPLQARLRVAFAFPVVKMVAEKMKSQ